MRSFLCQLGKTTVICGCGAVEVLHVAPAKVAVGSDVVTHPPAKQLMAGDPRDFTQDVP